jgi:8-oxo-dGTP pyrophosphatase MutT (NUDIX family)
MENPYAGMRAGGIPYYRFPDGVTRILTMVPSDPAYGGTHPQVAKGGIDDGETPEEAAIREVSEELGGVPDNLTQITYLGLFENIYIYTMKVIDPEEFERPCFETLYTKWVAEHELWSVRFRHHPIVKAAFAAIKSNAQSVDLDASSPR